MKKWKRLGKGFLLAVLSVVLWTQTVAAAEKDSYSYQVTFLPGDKGEFTNNVKVSCPKDADFYISPSKIVINGLQYDDKVSITFAEEDITLKDDKYYARGVRRSGRDNSAMESAVTVKRDDEFVVAYGVIGDSVRYTVNYKDRAGNTLYPSKTYRGNVGDKPIAGYIYIEGYQPQAYNLTKTLSVNEAENVFTFIYTPIARGSSGGGSTSSGGTSSSGTTGNVTEVTETTTGEVAGTGTVGQVGGTGAANGPVGDGTVGDGAAGDGTGAVNEADGVAEGGTESDEPQEPEELLNLDDEEIPLDQTPENGIRGNVNYLPIYTGATLAALAGLGIMFYILHKRKKDENKTT